METSAAPLHRQRGTYGDRGHPTLHAIAVKPAVRDVLAAPDSATYATLTTHDLAEQFPEIAGVREKMSVTAVIGKNDVVRVIEWAHDR
jgi:hypothetical protein